MESRNDQHLILRGNRVVLRHDGRMGTVGGMVFGYEAKQVRKARRAARLPPLTTLPDLWIRLDDGPRVPVLREEVDSL